jgi:hypothetical protein
MIVWNWRISYPLTKTSYLFLSHFSIKLCDL